MNDFTKEELIWLYETLQWIVEYFREPDSTYAIKDKLKSMIDNYCDHILSDAHYEQFRWQLCQKCGAQYK